MATATQTYNLTGVLGGLAFGFRDSNGLPSSLSNSLLTAVTKAFKDVITAPSGTYAPALTFSATVGVGSLVTVKKVMLVNKSATITGRVAVTDTGADQYIVELLPKSTKFFDSEKLEVKTDGSGFTGLSDMDTIAVAGVSGTADIGIVAVGT